MKSVLSDQIKQTQIMNSLTKLSLFLNSKKQDGFLHEEQSLLTLCFDQNEDLLLNDI